VQEWQQTQIVRAHTLHQDAFCATATDS